MASNKRRNLGGVVPSVPPLAPLVGGELARADRVGAVFAAQDRTLGQGRRILASGGRDLAGQFRVVGEDPVSLSQIYPAADAPCIVYRSPPDMPMTPGHWPRLTAIAVPSGMTQKFVPGVGYAPAGAGGYVLCECTFSNGIDTITVQREVTPPVSDREYAAEASAVAGNFNELVRLRSELIMVPGVDESPTTLAAWGDNVTVTITVAYVGGVRVVDWTVAEEPYKYSRTFTDTDWAGSLYTNAAGEPLTNYPSKYPVTHTNIGGDPSGGSTYLLDTTTRQARTLGPILVAQTTWDEGGESPTATEPVGFSTSSTSFVDMYNATIPTWSPNWGGWSVSSGANAPAWNTAGPCLELRDKARVVPVRVSVYCKVTGGTGTLRLSGEAYSAGELVVTSTSWGWVETDAHILCGFGPGAGQTSNVILFGRISSGAQTLSVRYITIAYRDV